MDQSSLEKLSCGMGHIFLSMDAWIFSLLVQCTQPWMVHIENLKCLKMLKQHMLNACIFVYDFCWFCSGFSSLSILTQNSFQALLGFVNFKLYHSINVKYPPILDPRLEALAAGKCFLLHHNPSQLYSAQLFYLDSAVDLSCWFSLFYVNCALLVILFRFISRY